MGKVINFFALYVKVLFYLNANTHIDLFTGNRDYQSRSLKHIKADKLGLGVGHRLCFIITSLFLKCRYLLRCFTIWSKISYGKNLFNYNCLTFIAFTERPFHCVTACRYSHVRYTVSSMN